jgi:hypothetical protein
MWRSRECRLTAAEASTLAVNVTLELSETRSERDAYRLIAIASVHHIHNLWQRLATSEERYHRALEDARRLRAQLLQDRQAA